MDDTLDAFFDPSDGHVVLCTRSRLMADDVAFHAIIGTTDEEALQGRVLAAHRTITFATGADLRASDTIVVTALQPWQAQFAGTYRMHGEPRRVNDGAESRATLVLITATEP